MARSQVAVRGRDRELTALLGGGWQEGTRGRLVVVTAPTGMGRTALLAAAKRRLRAQDVQVLGPSRRADRYGVAPILAGLDAHFDYVGLLDSVRRLRDLAAGDQPALPRITVEVSSIFEELGARGPVALLVDDVDRIAVPAPVLVAARRAGCLVVATCRNATHPGVADLLGLADDVIELGPLPDDVVYAALARQAGHPLDSVLCDVLHTALGSLFGNPGTALATLRELDACGRLVVHRDHMCLLDPAKPIGLPADHYLLDRTREADALRLAAVVAASGELDVDALAVLCNAFDTDVARCGRTLDALVQAEVLVADGFRVRPTCAALATALLDLAGGAGAVHAHIADAVASDRGVNACVKFADHVAQADAAGQPRDLSWLIELAQEIEPTDPGGALRYYLAALRFPPAGEPPCVAVLDRVLALTLRTGRYDWAHQVTADWPRPQHIPAALRVVARLAIIHTGRSMTAETKEWFSIKDIECADLWWFGDGLLTMDAKARPCPVRSIDGPVISAAELDLARSALSWDSDVSPAGPTSAELVEAGRRGDLATVLEIVLGDRYQVPETGPVATYQRLMRAFRTGDWTAALSAARELELSPAPQGRTHTIARIVAAEICAARGEIAQAAQWLADVRPDDMTRTLLAWARAGVLLRSGDGRGTAELARREAQLVGSGEVVPVGMDRLLARGAVAAVQSGDKVTAVALLRKLESWRRSQPTRIAEETVLLTRANVHRDLVAVETATDLVRDRNHVFDLLVARLMQAKLVDDPREALHEAYQLATRCGADNMRQLVLDLLRDRGVEKPQALSGQLRFTPVELRIIAMIRRGRTNRQIATALRVRLKTAENYLTRLLAKTGSRSRVELITACLALPHEAGDRSA